MKSQFLNMTSSPIFLTLLSFVVKFSYLSKIHVNTMIGSGFMTIFVYKRLTRNPEIGNTLVCVLANTDSLERDRDIKFSTNVSKKMLLNAAKCEGYNFSRF